MTIDSVTQNQVFDILHQHMPHTRQKYDTLREAITHLIIELHPIDGPRANVHIDPSLSFVSLSNNNGLKHLNVWLDVGRVKNVKKKPSGRKSYIVTEVNDPWCHIKKFSGSQLQVCHTRSNCVNATSFLPLILSLAFDKTITKTARTR